MRIELLDGFAELDRREVVRGEKRSRLTETEASLLRCLASRPNAAVKRGTLLVEVWGYHPDSATRTLDTTVRRLRGKIEPEPKRPQLLITAHGIGYRFQPPVRIERAQAADSTSTAPLANIPKDVTSFFGRQSDLHSLSAWLDSDCCAVVLGPGGVGKSRLARQAAHHWSLSEGAPAWWIPVASSDEDELANAVASRLKLRLPATEDRFDALGERLGRMGPMLLVFDGADDLPSALVHRLQAWAKDDLRILMTRRRRTEGPWPTLRLHPLTQEDAQALFLNRASTHFPAFEANAADLGRVLSALGGLPLAIQLAAARVRVLGLDELANRLGHGNDVLRDRSEPGEHGAMDRVLARSWDFLGTDQRRLLLACTAFCGSFTLALVQETLQDDAVDLIEALVDDGLLEAGVTDGGLHFEMLDCVRVFLQPGATDTHRVLARLATALSQRAKKLLDPLFGPTTPAACHWLKENTGNLDAALPYAAEDERRILLMARAFSLHELGDIRRSLTFWSELNTPLGAYHQSTSTLLDMAQRAALLEVAATSTDARIAAAVLLERSRLQSQEQGDVGTIALLEQALAAFESEQDVVGIAVTCSRLADAAAGIGELARAVAWRRQALDVAQGTGLLIGHQLRLVAYPLPLHEQPTLDELQETAEIASAIGNRRLLAQAKLLESHTALEQGLPERALSAARESVRVVQGVQSPITRAGLFGNAGIVLRELARFDEAVACFTSLEVLLGDMPVPHHRLALHINVAWCYLDQGRIDAAEERIGRIEPILPDASPFDRMRWQVLGVVASMMRGKQDESMLRRASEVFRESNAPTHLARSLVLLACLPSVDADDLLTEAMTLSDQHGDIAVRQAAELLWIRRGNPPRFTPDQGRAAPREYLSFVRLVERLTAR